jgi:catechol 2,3-dioxygenase-like lactoylglutathione lyase family enzyme
MLNVKTIDHVTFVVKDLDRSRAFYVDLLGMKDIPRPAFDFSGLWFQAGPTLVHLILEHDKSGPAGIFKPESFQSSRTHHVAFQVEDCPKAFEIVRQHPGAKIAHSLKQRPDGAWQFFLEDPDGHVIELTSGP